MESDPQSPLGHLNRGIDALEGGNKELAKRHFMQALIADPENELAWLWMTEASDNLGERRYCLDRAVAVNPDSTGTYARQALKAAGVRPVVPPVISDLESPPLPPTFATEADAAVAPIRIRGIRRTVNRKADVASEVDKRRWNWSGWLAIFLALAAILASVAVYRMQDKPELMYIALVGPMTGDSSAIGAEMRNAAEIAISDANANLDGTRYGLLVFDDQNNTDLAQSLAKQIVADKRIVGVIGHANSTTSTAAAPIYAAANMPVISGQATIDSLSEYPNYFRTIFSNRDEATILSQYINTDLGQKTVSIVAGPSVYEQSLASDFKTAFASVGTVANVWTITDDREASVAQVVKAMQANPSYGALFLALTESNGHEFLLQARRAGLNPMMIGSETLGNETLAQGFANEPEEAQTPGFFTNGLYAVSPLLYDAVGGETLQFAKTYRSLYGTDPGWRAPKIWEAVTALATADARGIADAKPTDMASRRSETITQLQHMDSPETGFQGLSGAIYFTKDRRSPQGFSVGQYQDRHLYSAPSQYRLVDNLTQYTMSDEVASKRAIALDGYYVRRYRVVYVGIEMIELRDLSTSAQSFSADFFMYFRYDGDDDPLKITFTNAADPGMALGDPINVSTTSDGMSYRLFRVQGAFNEPMQFGDYPWDRHDLSIRFQNVEHTQNDIVYVADPDVLQTSQEDRLRSGFDLSQTYNHIPSWNVESLNFEQVSIQSTADNYDTKGSVYYSEFRAVSSIERDVNSFLFKNLLPLALLTLVTYIAIWFPADQAGAKVGFAITALLSSSVMLGSISGQLPDIGYTVAIEWGYYAYIGLSAMLVLLTIAVERSYKAKRNRRVRRLDWFMRIMYPAAILAVILTYYIVFYQAQGGDQQMLKAGIVLVTLAMIVGSALVLFWPDHLDWRTLRGRNDPDRPIQPGSFA